ncbi:hypothetical protein O6H91_02G017300 [Diphasiastrum complanatum]|uniref:Uncharacterized protein n=1 Tax=Diphasiastrum complanatum TaxID=34168 RepID=A0ACC2ED39_DIPCM|nr:hypothetical protein O6H91_02G017300 [Diphasiastrum complanatum]
MLLFTSWMILYPHHKITLVMCRSFDARWSCYSRTYSYLLPAAILGINQSTSINERKERIEKLQTILRLFEGRYPFHNYTVRSRYRYRSKKPFTCVSRPGENLLEQEDLNEGDEEQSVNEFGFRTKANDTLRNNRTADGTRRMMINEEEMDSVSWDEAISDLVSDIDNRGPTSRKAWWVHEPDGVDKIGTAHFRKIYSCSCGQVEVYGDVCFVRIIITGESFMLRQVRKMVGTAVAVLRDVLPVDIIQVSLSRHSRVILPLAPAEGLVLSNSEFLPFKRGHISSDRFTKLKTDSENSRLKMSSLVASKAQTFWQNTLLPRMFPLMDASNLPWSAWVETLESHGGIPAAEISELQYAWSSWKENNFLKKQQMHQEEQKWFELSGTTECNTRLQA